MRTVLVAVAVAASFATFAAEPVTGPFGFTKGMTLAQLQALGKITKGAKLGQWRTETPPKPHADFDGFILIVSPTRGLCKVAAIGRDIVTNRYGSALSSAFERIDSALTNKYGEGEKYDSLYPGSIWNEPRDWMMGLAKRERSLWRYWSKTKGGTLPDSIEDMMLEAKATGTEKGYLVLSIEYTEYEECKKELDAKRDEAL
jgi:hypothetical protein